MKTHARERRVSTGTYRFTLGGRLSIELGSVAIAGDDRVIRTWRSLKVDGDNLAYTMGMATTQVPDGAIHLAAKLSRR